MPEKLKMSAIVPAEPKEVYTAWLDSKAHGEFTGGEAKIEPKVNGKFTAWDGYIEGTTVKLEPYERIVQKWRTSDFADDDPDSDLEVNLEEAKGGTRITIIHTNIPDGQSGEYKEGWEDYYFLPMKEFFKKK